MATISVVHRQITRGVMLGSWLLPLTSANADGQAFNAPNYFGKTVTASGTFSGPATVAIEGSNDNSNWFALHDPQGVVLAFTAAGSKKIAENPLYIRPKVTGADVSTSVTVLIEASQVGWVA